MSCPSKENDSTKLKIMKGAKQMTNRHVGSTFDSFLEEEGLLDDVEATAIKRMIAYEIEQTMKQTHLTKSAMAKKLHTSRPALNRLLDPNNTSITLHTLIKITHVLRKKLQLSFA